MFITQAFAQSTTAAAPATTAAPGSSDMLMSMLPFLFIFAILYFLIIRPQQRRMKQHGSMVTNLRRGDTVVTAGGLIGKIDRVVDENEVVVELNEGNKVRVVRSTIADVRGKGEPVKADNDEDSKPAKTKNKKSA